MFLQLKGNFQKFESEFVLVESNFSFLLLLGTRIRNQPI